MEGRILIPTVIFLVLLEFCGAHTYTGKNQYASRQEMKIAKDREFHHFLDNYKTYNDRFDHHKLTLLDMITGLEEEAVVVLEAGLRPLFSQVDGGEKHLNNILDVVSGVTPAEEEEEEEEITQECNRCLLLTTALKALSFALPWETMRGPVVFICEALGPIVAPDVNHGVLCPAAIDTQGPVVHDVLGMMTILPLQHCEFMNLCLPDRPESNTRFRRHIPESPKPIQANKNKPNLDNALKIAAFADFHVDPAYTEGTETNCQLPVCCSEQWGEGGAGKWGDYACNIPERTIDLFMDKAREIGPDFAVYGGDSPPHTMWVETKDLQFNCTRKVARAMARGLPGVRVLPNIGNHEMYPTNIYFMDMEETQLANELFIEEWGPVAQFTPDDIDNMRHSAYFATRLEPGLVAISWNTNYMYTWNWYNVVNHGRLRFGQNINYVLDMQEFMVEKLEEAQANGDKVIIIGHHPSGLGDTFLSGGTWWLSEQMTRFKDIIVLHLVGHYHSGGFRMFLDPANGEPSGIQHNIPALSTDSYRNPSFRIFYHDRDTFELLDFDQYMLDIDEIIDGHEPEIKHIFRASEEYGLNDMSVESWWNLIARMKDDYGLFMTYHYNTQSRTIRGHSCPRDTCMVEQLCRAATTNYDDYRDCLAEYADVPTTTLKPTAEPTEPPTDGAESYRAMSAPVLLLASLMLIIFKA